VRAVDTGEREELECGLVLRSIGYKGAGLAGLPFDERRGTIPNDHGRVLDPETDARVPGLYAVGWIKRGPSGVIGTNKKDAQDTVDSLLADLESGLMPEPSDSDDPDEVAALIAERCPDHVTFAGWKAIDRAEVELGEPLGRPRVKFTSVAEMLEAAQAAEPVGS
jgi:ferredoxin--NADP+ reductase